MVPEGKTNFLYFSDLLPSKYPIFWRNLAEILQQAEINYNFLAHTKDIWCRDYMPVQIDKNEFIQFKYDPDYLKGWTKPLKWQAILHNFSKLKFRKLHVDLCYDFLSY
ncbi:hypothetical protein JCM12298_12870 [Desulfothermus naphthae]